MASIKLSEPWNGIQRANENYYVESCYAVFQDTENLVTPYYLCLNGFSIYTDSKEDLTGLLPVSVSIQINGENTYTFTTGGTIRTNTYSPSGNLMRYAATVTTQDKVYMPETSGTFTIHVTVTPAGHSPYRFDEIGYRPVENILTPPQSMITGSVYDFTLNRQALVGELFSNQAILRFAPQFNNVTVMSTVEYGYVDPYTKVSDATSAFNVIQFAVANPGFLVEYSSETITGEANVTFQTRYMSEDFHNGVLITDLSARLPLTAQEEVDPALRPTLAADLISISGTNEYGSGSGVYVHRQSVLTVTPAARFQYGDSAAYIQYDGKNYFSPSITTLATGIEPGISYVRPDTGATETAGQETVGSVTVSVCGKKWGQMSDAVIKTYRVLWYLTPRVNAFSVHRAVRTTTATNYQFNNYYYQKDDFGKYCIVEYDVEFASLNNQNHTSLVLSYGTSSAEINISSSMSGFYVFSAGDSAMDVTLELTDNFYPYGIVATVRLSTSGILLDYLAGGKGMAVGKTATEQKALDIASDWRLLFYQADVGAYNDDTSSQDLVTWMHGVDARLTALENN